MPLCLFLCALTGDTGAAELSKPAAEGSQNLTWLSHWGLHEFNDVAGWREAHVPGKVGSAGE